MNTILFSCGPQIQTLKKPNQPTNQRLPAHLHTSIPVGGLLPTGHPHPGFISAAVYIYIYIYRYAHLVFSHSHHWQSSTYKWLSELYPLQKSCALRFGRKPDCRGSDSPTLVHCRPSLSPTFLTTMELSSQPLAPKSCSSITRSTTRLTLPTTTQLSSSSMKPLPRVTPMLLLNCRLRSSSTAEVWGSYLLLHPLLLLGFWYDYHLCRILSSVCGLISNASFKALSFLCLRYSAISMPPEHIKVLTFCTWELSP